MNATQTVTEPSPALHVAAESAATVATPTATNLATDPSLPPTPSTAPPADVDMDSVAPKDEDEEDRHASDNESVASNSTLNPPSKKKKGQRFYCTDFPPCQLSFTRSEHLARHIRKHTGERPFQCHCSRRFSRLDNLRQHAQTVHVNEDIPGDSLAATGTRFQRQVRTDRVRPANRSRTSSLTHGTPVRGHGRHLSTSSIGSVASSIASPDDYLRRPMTMSAAIPGSPSTTPLSLDTRTALADGARDSAPYPHQSHQYYSASHSPGGYSTPTSAAYTGTTSSPRHSGLQSPIAVGARPIAWPTGGLHRRRLSVPSASISQQRLSVPSYPAPLLTPLTSSNASTYSNSTSLATSPTSSTFSELGRDGQSEADIRRRTWHPTTASALTGRPATSGLSYYQTPDSPRPVAAMQPAAAQAVRLPGIDSFDRMNAQSTAPARRPPSPMHLDDPPRPDSAAGALGTAGSHKRRPSETQWDTMNQNLTRLEIASPHRPSSWRNSLEGPPISAPTFLPADPRRSAGSATFSQLQPPLPVEPSQLPGPAAEMPFRPREEPVTPRKKKRQGLYVGGSGAADVDQRALAQRTSPEDSSSSEGIPTPSTTSTGDYHPAIVHSNGFIETPSVGSSVDEAHKTYVHPSTQMASYPPRTPPLQSDSDPHTPRPALNMDRLDALAAVASSAGQHM